MKNSKKLFGIIAIAAIIGFSMMSCDDGATNLGTPANVRVTGQTSTTITLEWNAVQGADGYYVYQQTSSGSFQSLGSVYTPGAEISQLSPGTSYTFKVSAFNRAGEGGQSSAVTGTTSGSGNNYNTSLNGTWVDANNTVISVNGSIGIIISIHHNEAYWLSAISKGYVKVGDQFWRNLRSTGNLTWSGEQLGIYHTSDVATGTGWNDVTFTMSANGQTITVNASNSNNNIVWTRQ